MLEPDFAFTIPSLEDDLPLDCRIYNSSVLAKDRRGAIVAHPYAPLGGSQDDNTVISVVETLLKSGYTVATFNFRGAGESAGKTSWTGRPEIEDYTSVVGLLIYFLRHLGDLDDLGPITPDLLVSQKASPPTLKLVLGGYSFGSLILARLAAVTKILERFESAERGSAASEIELRAIGLAKQTAKSRENRSIPRSGGRRFDIDGSWTRPHSPASPVTFGGDETDPSERRSSRDKRSLDIVREVPHRLRMRMRRLSNSHHHEEEVGHQEFATMHIMRSVALDVKYLLISPVLIPLTPHLLPPGLPFSLALPATPSREGNHADSGLLSLLYPALAVFGTSDNFTSAKRLRHWAEKLSEQSTGRLQWTQIEGAGHFWREKDVMQAMQTRITDWLSMPGTDSPS